LKALIIGAKGMLGQAMVAEAEKRGIDYLGVTHNQLDITDVITVRDLIKSYRPDAVLNCAAYTNVDEAESQPELAMKVNGIGPRNLALACAENGSILLHISTDYIFDGEKERAYEIWDKPNPINVYGGTKLSGENYIRSIMTHYLIIRTSWLFGHGGRNFVSTMLDLAKRGDTIRVINDQKGCPTYTVDLAKTCLDLLDRKLFGIYHVTNQGITTWYGFARTIFEMTDTQITTIEITTEEFPRPARRPKNSVLLSSSLKRALGQTLPTYKDALRRYFNRGL
jgi:dTDP-4-dehydrorhamnose reductase